MYRELEAPEVEELRLLRDFWDMYWNGPGNVEIDNTYTGYTHDQMQELDDAAARVEDHYVECGYYPESRF